MSRFLVLQKDTLYVLDDDAFASTDVATPDEAGWVDAWIERGKVEAPDGETAIRSVATYNDAYEWLAVVSG